LIRKTAFLITGTVAGVVGVLSYNPPQLNNSIASSNTNPVPDATTSPSSSTTSSASSTTVKTTSSKSPAPKSTSTKESAKSTQSESQTQSASQTQNATQTQSPTPVAKTSGTFAGDTSVTRWGPVQVQVIVSDGKITDVSTLQYPNGDRKSLKISNQVIPWLQQEVLKVQSANISGISGATYTSNGFKASLASALQKAGL